MTNDEVKEQEDEKTPSLDDSRNKRKYYELKEETETNKYVNNNLSTELKKNRNYIPKVHEHANKHHI